MFYILPFGELLYYDELYASCNLTIVLLIRHVRNYRNIPKQKIGSVDFAMYVYIYIYIYLLLLYL